MHETLSAWLAANIDPDFARSTFRRIGTGHSRAMHRVTADSGRRIAVRVEQGGVFGTTSAEECRVMGGLHQVGFPVARILGSELTGVVVGQPFFVMEFLAGIEETVGGGSAEREAAVPDERLLDLETAESFVDMLARLHALDGAGFGFDIVPPSPSDATRLQVQRWLDVYRSATSSTPIDNGVAGGGGDLNDAGLVTQQGSTNIPSLANIEICAFAVLSGNCSGGSVNEGVQAGQSDQFTLTLAGNWGSTVDIAPIGFKFQGTYGSYEFYSSSSTSTTSTTGGGNSTSGSVPEPGAGSLALLGLGLLGAGFGLRRKQSSSSI